MNVKETFVSFTGIVDIGRLALYVNIDDNGGHVDLDDLITQIVHFNTVVLYGNPYQQKEDIPKIVRKATKLNSKITFQIHSTGLIHPTGIGNFDNVKHYVHLQLKNSGLEYKDRLVDKSVTWFANMGAYFIFNIESKDDIDEADMLIQNYSIEKRQVFITTNGETTSEQLDMLIKGARAMGYNFTIDVKELFWKDYGRNKDEQKRTDS